MLATKGGWEVTQINRLNYYSNTPFRWTQKILDNIILSIKSLDNKFDLIYNEIIQNNDNNNLINNFNDINIKIINFINELKLFFNPYFIPIINNYNDFNQNYLQFDIKIISINHYLNEFEKIINEKINLNLKIENYSNFQFFIHLKPLIRSKTYSK